MERLVNINVTIPSDILLSLRTENDDFAAQMKSLTALKLCETRKLSIGQSAALAGMDEEDFIRFLGRNKVSIFGSASEIEDDFGNA